MDQRSRTKSACSVALVAFLLMILGPLVLGLHGGAVFVAVAPGMAATLVAAKAIWWPADFDHLLLVGTGALVIFAAFAAGGVTLWVHSVGGAAILGSGLWRRFTTEPAGNAQTSPS